jgi:hypothetical protein
LSAPKVESDDANRAAVVDDSRLKGVRRYGRDEFNALFAGTRPATDDDVSITTDGRALDSVDAVLEFVRDVELERAAARSGS